jgi:hypothetical protein
VLVLASAFPFAKLILEVTSDPMKKPFANRGEESAKGEGKGHGPLLGEELCYASMHGGLSSFVQHSLMVIIPRK